MVVRKEVSLNDFEFWSGAVQVAERFSYEEMETIESMLEDIEPEEGWEEVAINDIFWFEPEMLLEWLGIDEEEFWKR